MTTLVIEPQPVPLRQDDTGAIRVGSTRVLLELLIRAFQDGASPESIVQRYETLKLADVYAVISYYLTHQQEIEEYLRQREELADQVRRKIEAGQVSRPDFAEELRARYAQLEKNNAPASSS
ncbi:MAG TPA: DUF433 domain-containing protein [Gemmataceae bacterium]|jgi:uncharacterized protein (DUF433 family)|nr:DUF433 domain-containing protein [Gemmataceae bacterium]